MKNAFEGKSAEIFCGEWMWVQLASVGPASYRIAAIGRQSLADAPCK